MSNLVVKIIEVGIIVATSAFVTLFHWAVWTRLLPHFWEVSICNIIFFSSIAFFFRYLYEEISFKIKSAEKK